MSKHFYNEYEYFRPESQGGDPCPACPVGVVCRHPNCGRLKERQKPQAKRPIVAYKDIWRTENTDKAVMMRAHGLCPTALSHPEKMEWMASYFRLNSKTEHVEGEHAAAEKHGCHGGEGATLPAAGVSDVAALVDWLRWKYSNIPDVMKAASAIAALQSQVKELRLDLEATTLREHKTEKRQAKRIKELEAKLGESIEFIESMRPNTHSEVWPDIYAFLSKAREAMK